MVALAIVVALVAIVIPTCRMVGCAPMKMGAAMPFGHQPLASIFSDCGGDFVINSAPVAVVPAGADSLTLTLSAAVLAAFALLVPRMTVSRANAVAFVPPPPPEVPRGERFRV